MTTSTGGAPAATQVPKANAGTRQLSQEVPGFGQAKAGGSTGPDTPGKGSPLERFEGIQKGSYWNAYTNAAVKHLRTEAAALDEAGLYLYKKIRQTKAWPWQAGKVIAAKMLSRRFKRAANLLEKAAQEIVMVRREHAARFGGKSKAKASDFDPEA